jgi:hypothetical protein
MTYAELLKIGSMNEIAQELVEIIGKRNTRSEHASQLVRDALIEFFERGASTARREMQVQHNGGDSDNPVAATDDEPGATQH